MMYWYNNFMNAPFSYSELAEKIKEVFIHQGKYQFGKNLDPFTVDGEYAGDFLNYLIFEPQGEKPPRFYAIGSSYDVISKKAPQQAMIFENGQVILNIDYTAFCDMRTGLMDALVMQALGYTDITGKKILYLGTGGVARASLQALKELFPEVQDVDYINRSQDPKEFGGIARELGVQVHFGDLENIGQYDFIFGHTTSTEPVLTASHLQQIKKGAFISCFVAMGGEIADKFFTTNNVNLIADYEKTKEVSNEMKKAIGEDRIDEEKVIYLKDLFEGTSQLLEGPLYTLYRSTGTPMQNLAVLKLLLASK